MKKATIRKVIILVLALAVLVVVALLASQSRTDNGIDAKPEGVDTDFSSHANIVDGEELLEQLGSLDSFDLLARDLHHFAQATYYTYKSDPNRVVGFRITSPVEVQAEKLLLHGHFGSSRNEIAVIIKKLNNNRIVTSITDTETGFNADETLPSNSKLNRFLGSLPITNDQYSINFVSSLELEIAIYSNDPEIYDAAYKVVEDSVGKEEADKINLTVSLPSLFFE